MSLRDLSSLSLNNDHKLFDIVVVTVDHPSLTFTLLDA